MTAYQLTGHWLTPDRGRALLVVGPSLGTGVVALWDGCASSLQDLADVDVLGWDLPGHGDGAPAQEELSVDDLAVQVADLVDRVRPGQPFVHAGDSVGGLVGLALADGTALTGAGRDTSRVLGSAVVCSSARFGAADAWLERADLVRRAGTPVMVEGSVQRWFGPGFLERQPRVATALLTSLQHADKESYARVCEALARADLRPRLGAIAVPVCVVGGLHDAVCPPEQQRKLAAAIPGATLAIVEDAAHLAPAEAPNEVAEILAGWLAGLRIGGTGAATPDPATTAGRHAAGMTVRREVLSDEHVDRAEARKTAFTNDFQDLITRYAWGEVWTRPGLDRRTRSAITLTALIALGHWGELEMHVRAALRNGLTPDEIGEVLLQSAIYCGVPAANHAFGIAQQVLEQEGQQ